ncbi:MAG: lipopolysaccharide biosynthesis protein [Bacteroidota bacterium]
MEAPTFKRTFFKHLVTLGSYSYGSEIVNFLSSAILARLLMPEEYGFVAMIAVFTNFAMIFAGAGLGSDIIRSNYRTTYHKGLFTLSFYIGLFLFVGMSLLAYPIALFYGNSKLIVPTIVLSTQFVIRGMTMAHYALLMKQMRFNYIGKVTFYTTLLNIALMILMALLGFSYWSLIIPLLIMAFVRYYFYAHATRLPMKLYSRAHVVVAYRKAKSIIWSIIGFNVIDYWARNLDNLLAGKFYGEASLGIYNRGFRFLDLSLQLITRMFGTVLYPSLKKLEEDKGPVLKEYLNMMGVISLINFPAGLLLIVFPEPFVLLLWGRNWLEVVPFLPYFGLLILTQTVIATNDSMFKLLNKERTLFYLGAVSSGIVAIAIALGATQSLLSIAKFYAFAYLIMVIPLQLYVGFIRALGYQVKVILLFWLPKMVCFYAILLGLWIDEQTMVVMGILAYFLHLVYFQRKDLSSIIKLVVERWMKKKEDSEL